MVSGTPTLLERPTAEARTVEDLVAAARAGEVRIPPFQRGFRWSERDVRDLFDSLWRGFPVGSLLLWEREAPAARLRFGSLEVDAHEERSALWVVDGQHRLTALVATLVEHDHPDPAFELFFDLESEAFVRKGARRIAPPTWLPLAVLIDTNRLLDQLGLLRDAGLAPPLVDRARDLARAIGQYRIPLSIVRSPDEAVLREIFYRVNNAGRRMTPAEVFRALHAAIGEQDPSDLRSLIDEIATMGFGTLREDTVLRCVLAVRGGDVYRSFEHEFDEGDSPVESFKSTSSTLHRVFTFLRDDAFIPHIRALPYAGVLPILTRFFVLHPDPGPRSRTLLRRWLWRGSEAWGRDVGTLRRAVQQVDQNEERSVQVLLQQLGAAVPPPIDLDAVQLNKAAAKMNISLLASLRPQQLDGEGSVDVGALLDDEGAQALTELVPSTDARLAGRLLHPATEQDLLGLVLSATDGVLASHAITPEARDALRDGDEQTFVGLRAQTLGEVLGKRRAQLAEPNAADHPSIASLVIPDGD